MNFDDIQPLEEATSPEAIMSYRVIAFYIAGAVLAFILLLVAAIRIFIITGQKRQLETLLAPFHKALTQLNGLKKQSLDTKTAALESSLIFRELLQEETGDKALFETHEEFSLRPDALASLPLSAREETRHYLQKLARLKYIPNYSQEDAANLVDEAINLVNSLAERIKEENLRKKHSPSVKKQLSASR